MQKTLDLGRIVGTPGALRALQAMDVNPTVLLLRHASGDWGDLEFEEDRQANDRAFANGEERILSSYNLEDGTRIWIITEWDRSATTLLLPEEY